MISTTARVSVPGDFHAVTLGGHVRFWTGVDGRDYRAEVAKRPAGPGLVTYRVQHVTTVREPFTSWRVAERAVWSEPVTVSLPQSWHAVGFDLWRERETGWVPGEPFTASALWVALLRSTGNRVWLMAPGPGGAVAAREVESVAQAEVQCLPDAPGYMPGRKRVQFTAPWSSGGSVRVRPLYPTPGERLTVAAVNVAPAGAED